MRLLDYRAYYRDSYDGRALSGITTVVWHHADTPIPASPEAADAQIDGIWSWHTGHNGWPGIGYHFIIDPWGTVYQVNDLTDLSYHTAYHNEYTIGVCFLGDYEFTHPSPAALAAGRELMAWLDGRIGRVLAIRGHAETNPASTAFCPSRKWHEWKGMLDPQGEEMSKITELEAALAQVTQERDALRGFLAQKDSELGALKVHVVAPLQAELASLKEQIERARGDCSTRLERARELARGILGI